MGEFGDKFRKARESRELSLDDVSNVTKISARMLQAIEEEHFDQLPGGVFNKGFIRAYAKHLGLDSEDAVTGYLSALRQAQIDAHEVWQPKAPPAPPIQAVAPPQPAVAPPPKPAAKSAPVHVEELPDLQLPREEHVRTKKKEFLNESPSGIPRKLIAATGLVVIAALFFWMRHARNAHTVDAKNPAPTTVSAAPAIAPAQPTTPPVTPPKPTANNQPPKPAPAAHAATPASATPADAVDEKVIEKSDVTIRSFGQQATPESTKPVASLNLVIRATETSWISVTSDGGLVTQETLIAPANTTIHATREIVVRVGNAAGVAFLWNGEELPPQGGEAEAKTLVFNHDGMKALSSQAP